jgi:hypothetical protein
MSGYKASDWLNPGGRYVVPLGRLAGVRSPVAGHGPRVFIRQTRLNWLLTSDLDSQFWYGPLPLPSPG